MYNTGSYLHTAIYECGLEDECIDKVKTILDNNNIKYTFKQPDSNERWYPTGYIDHGYELKEFVQDLCEDEDKLLRYLFGDSVIYTGNDNSEDDYSRHNIADEYMYDDDYNCSPNENRDDENYEYYMKGN